MDSVRELICTSESYRKRESQKDENLSKNRNWQMSYNFTGTCPYWCKKESGNVCPIDRNTLKHHVHDFSTDIDFKSKSECVVGEDISHHEFEAGLDFRESDSEIKSTKTTAWEEYKKLVELAKSMPRSASHLKPLKAVTSQTKLRIGRIRTKSQPKLSVQAKRSIIKTGNLTRALVADSNYVTFHNFEPNKLYKKTVTLQNVSNSPVRFQIDGRPIRSKFMVMIKSIKGERCIIPPGMRLHLIIFFRCDIFDQPEELLVINVEKKKPITIKLHGYKDPPILKGIEIEEKRPSFPGVQLTASIHDWSKAQLVGLYENESVGESTSSITDTTSSNDKSFVSTIFDCKTGFAGEQIHMPMKLKNSGGKGRFFIMSEIDWCSMHIEDITNRNTLILPSFTIWPVYFSLNTWEEILVHTYFHPTRFGVYVDKLYILSDNCSVIATEIIGDGIMYEPDFIQLNKKYEKKHPCEMDIDKCAQFYVNLGSGFSNGTIGNTISLSNASEIGMHFRWEKRAVRSEENKITEKNYLPLNLLDIYPNRGMFTPSSTFHFSVTAELKNLPPNRYFAIFRLYVEDIPVTAISKNLDLHTVECTTRRRICGASVDVWVADIEVWVECKSRCDSKKDDLSVRTLESEGEMQMDSDNWLQDYYQQTDTMQDIDYQPMLQLSMDELFSHYDTVDLKQIEPLFREYIIMMGTIRLTRPLYVGVEETHTLIVKNLAKHSLVYTWGVPLGSDESKLTLHFSPVVGEVSVGTAEQVKITFSSTKEGPVRSLYVPCYVGDFRKVIMLGIECDIEPFHVSFYFPSADQESLRVDSDFLRVVWRANSLNLALDLAGKPGGNVRLLDKYRAREDEELMSTNLDQGDVLKDVSAGPSMYEVHAEESGEQFSSSTNTSEIIRNKELAGHLVPFHRTILSPPPQSVVLEFLQTPLRKIMKKTIVIKNETPITSSFRVEVKNFHPSDCSCKKTTTEEYIKAIYRKAFGRDKGLVEDTLSRLMRNGSGIVIYVDPLKSDLGPFKALPIDIYIFADTWGVYVDEIEINILGLPDYTFGICVQVIGSPISLPMCEGTLSKMPVFRYGPVRLGTRPKIRTIFIKNTSVLPVAVNWHSFLIKPTTTVSPFNVLVDILTPFTNSLASAMRVNKTDETIDKLLTVHMERYKPDKSSEVLKDFYPISVTDSDIIDGSDVSDENVTGTPLSTLSYSLSTTSDTLNNRKHPNSESVLDYSSNRSDKSGSCRDEYLENSTSMEFIDQSQSAEGRDTEFQISIIPYHGVADSEACTVTPREIFILPKGNATVSISLQPDKFPDTEYKKEYIFKHLGYIRVAPIDKYRDNKYSREDGCFFPPVELTVEVEIIKPRLDYDISKYDRTFTCSANDVLHNRKRLQMKKTFFFYNCERNTLYVNFDTHDPFAIRSVWIYASANPCKPAERICINGNGCAEVEVICTVDSELIEIMLNTDRYQELQSTAIVIREPLIIMHSDSSIQEVELILQILLPSFKLSSYTLNFGFVYVGDTKKLLLVIVNSSACKLNFTISKKFDNSRYSLNGEKGKELSYTISGNSSFPITIAFTPKIPEQSVETLEIKACSSYSTEECALSGEGTFDEKYHTPGV